MDSLDRAGHSMVALPMIPCACRGGGPCLEVQGDPLHRAALRMLLGQAVVEGGQAAPLLVGPGARRVRLQLQRLPQAVVVPVVVGVQRQQLPAGRTMHASMYTMLYGKATMLLSLGRQIVRSQLQYRLHCRGVAAHSFCQPGINGFLH